MARTSNNNHVPFVSLSEEKKHELFVKYKQGNIALEQELMGAHYSLVSTIALGIAYTFYDIEFDDAFQIGCIKLLEAIRNFDLSYGVKFATYATPKIRGGIIDYLRQNDVLNAMRSIRKLASIIKETQNRLEFELGREVTIIDLSNELGIDKSKISEALSLSTYCVSFDESINNNDNDESLLDITTDNMNPSNEWDTTVIINEALNYLDNKQRMIVNSYYFEDMSTISIASALHVSESRISQLKSKALKKLRRKIKSVS